MSSQRAANSVHTEIEVLLKEVNEARDEMKARRRKELGDWYITNPSEMLSKPQIRTRFSRSLTDKLLSEGTLTLGGSMSGDPKLRQVQFHHQSVKEENQEGRVFQEAKEVIYQPLFKSNI